MVDELYHANRKTDGWTGIVQLVVAFHNYAKAPKNVSLHDLLEPLLSQSNDCLETSGQGLKLNSELKFSVRLTIPKTIDLLPHTSFHSSDSHLFKRSITEKLLALAIKNLVKQFIIS